MCNLYRITTSHEAMTRLGLAFEQPQLDLDRGEVFPDQDAPIIHLDPGGAPTLSRMRWGFPPPPKGRAPVTNVRNTASPFWRPWLKRPYRCLAPFTAFAENDAARMRHWFDLGPDQPLAAFAGIWRPWSGERLTEVEGAARRRRRHRDDWRLYAFLTTEPNAVVAPIHEKAMPVVLTTPQECDLWLTGDDDQVLALARPLPDHALRHAGPGR